MMSTLPRWDVSPIFPALASPAFQAAFSGLKDAIGELAELFEERGVRRRTDLAVDAAAAARDFDEVTGRLNRVLEDLQVVRSYISAFVTTNASDDLAQSLSSELRVARARLNQLLTRYVAWAGTADVEALLAMSEAARDHEFLVRQATVRARHQMSEAEEEVAAELAPPGVSAWARLHSDVTAMLTVDLSLRGEARTLPMSAVRALANDPDRDVRRTAYEAELSAWKSVEVPLAAALNGVKGYQQVVRRRRRYADDVEPTLLDNAIDHETLTAMQRACVEAFPDFRRYLWAKARALGLARLAWYDLAAPVGPVDKTYSWPEAEAFIRNQFAAYSDRLAGFGERSFRERWIDAEPRAGKEGGAFCMQVRPGESRILMNYDGSFNSVSTLAHELGHAYHNLNLEPRTALQAWTPSALAETASIFCETLVFEAALAHAEEAERLALLETSLQRDLMVVVDIHSRFLFEQGVFERRGVRELTPREFSDLMVECQLATYGDVLDPRQLHPYMWAVKGHYYGPTFYNYPYTFGLLFGLGLYARCREDPEQFRARYDELLSSTGLADAAALAQRFGMDTRDEAFWRSSLDVIRGNIDRFEGISPERILPQRHRDTEAAKRR